MHTFHEYYQFRKGKYYSGTLSIPPPKFLISSSLRLEEKVLRFGGASPGRTTESVSAQFNVRVD